MAKKTAASPPTDWRAPRLAGKVFVLGGGPRWSKDFSRRAIQGEGGRLAEKVTEETDFVVIDTPCPTGRWSAQKKAELNRRKGAAIRVLDRDAFLRLFAPSREEALAMLAAGEAGVGRFNALRLERPDHAAEVPMPALGAVDFRKAMLRGVRLSGVDLDGADFRAADLRGAVLPAVKGANFAGACLAGAWCAGFTDCDMCKADLSGGHSLRLERCDLTGAKLEAVQPWKGAAQETTFRRADLRRARLTEGRFRGCDFSGADLTEVNLTKSDLAEVSLVRARLEKAALEECNLRGARLEGACLVAADLTKAKLQGADLRRADLRGANLLGADFTDARLDGADFTGANLVGTKLPADTGKAKGLGSARRAGRSTGPHLRELADLAGSAKRFKSTAVFDLPAGRLLVGVSETNTRTAHHAGLEWYQYTPAGERWRIEEAISFSAGMLFLGNKWSGGTLRFGSITVRSDKTPRGKDLWKMVASAWCETFGLEVPSAEELARLQAAGPQEQQRVREEYLAELRGGPEGVCRWNARNDSNELEKVAPSFTGADLSGADLSGAQFSDVDFSSARFDGARIPDIKTYRSDFRSASFRRAELTGGTFNWETVLEDADFTGATLAGSNLSGMSCQGAKFHNADLSGASFDDVGLEGADLSSANLRGATFERTRYDSSTRLPPGAPPEGLVWVGQGEQPRLHQDQTVKPNAEPEAMDIDTFMRRLRASVDEGRLDNALTMLRAERFQLFAEVTAEHLVGVVKSQSTASRVYSCRLDSGGSFSCCTQNLRPCGGLQGAVCKHLLVLVVGLVKSGQADPTALERWVSASRKQRPVLDRDVMSATFLRYKGAEAGEVDWRPTETIPEDYYSL
jgi:uncharacterized protein YjbI with pentapeptide repeats